MILKKLYKNYIFRFLIILKILFIFCLSILILGCAKKINPDILSVDLPKDKHNIVVSEKGLSKANDMTMDKAFLEPLAVEEPNIRNVKLKKELELKTIYFDFDSSEIKEEYRDMLKNNADWIKNNPSYNILIQGHTDNRGSTKYNLGLGQDRASKVRAYLAYLEINPKRIATISYGEEKPEVNLNNEEAWAKNRRAELLVYKDDTPIQKDNIKEESI